MRVGKFYVGIVFGLLSMLCHFQAIGAASDENPFTDVTPNAAPPVEKTEEKDNGFFSDNFAFRREIMSQFGAAGSNTASRQSVGFEAQKKFSSDVKTIAAVDFQARLVRRDGFVGSLNDIEGMNRMGWSVEYHNAYADLYNVLGPVGRFNAQIGHFYLPFGLNLQTDTHGTILQLSNERNFGFERDWYAGLWGNLNRDLRYDLYYTLGSGYPIFFSGQSGLLAARISLANKYLSENGLEGGVSFLAGQRLSPDAVARSPAVALNAGPNNRVNTWRAGLDGRYRKPVPGGLLTWTSELSGGLDNPDAVVTQLHQLEYLTASRRWGLATQYRWFWQNMSRDRQLSPLNAPGSTDSSIIAEATWYFSNDVGNANLHWIKLNYELPLARQIGGKNGIWTLQYYRYW